MADFQYGLTCIVTSVKGNKEVNLKFVMDKKQYTVTYKEGKSRYDDRNLAKLLLAADALKASAWNVPIGPPGSNKNSWYVTDVWTPKIAGMEKKRLPEPTLSIVCRVTYKLGKEFVVCEVGKHFTRDVMILPRSVIQSVSVNTQPEIGDYLLVFALLIWELQGNDQRARLIPIWAHWDKLNCTQSSTAHLNIVECGPENETLLVPDQIPCMWGVVQNVYKKSLQAYVPCISSSVSVPFTAIYQYISAMHILEGDWVQLWLMPQVSGQPHNHISDVNAWVCSHCCWFGSRAKKRYETYLQQRLTSRYHRHSLLTTSELESSRNGDSKTKQNPSQAQDNAKSLSDIVGRGKVTMIKERSGTLKCGEANCKKEHVFHLGMMTVYGVKMINVKKAKIKDILDQGSDIRYRMNPTTKNLKSVWIGPEVVSFKNLNFMPQLTIWLRKRNLDGAVVREMMKEITDCFEGQNSAKSATDSKVGSETTDTVNATKEKKVESEGNENWLASVGVNQLLQALDHPSLLGKMEASVDKEVPSEIPVNCEGQPSDEILDTNLCYSKEEEEEIEKLWWSEDSEEESDDELRPISNVSPSLDTASRSKVLVEESRASRSTEIGSLSSEEQSGQDNGSENGLSLSNSHSTGDNKGNEREVSGGTPESRDPGVASSLNLPLTAEPVSEESKPQETEKNADAKIESSKSASTLLVMMELTKFLILKGKVVSVAEAGEMSADFVSRLESVVGESTTQSAPTQSVGTQTEITGPFMSLLLGTSDNGL